MIELENLLHAYRVAVNISDHGFELPTIKTIKYLGQLIEPEKNMHGFRQTPVVFGNGGSSSSPSTILTGIRQFTEILANPEFEREVWSIESVIKMFLEIHPFVDGNGRLAWILYNWLGFDLDHPYSLPQFDFMPE